jgi:dihydroorotase-like cyclic amidohydrolase
MKQVRPFTITHAQLVTPQGVVTGAIRCADGLIAAVGSDVVPVDGDALFNARGKLVAPGLVDLGVFAVDKPAFHFGGITRAALMPDQSPPLDLPSRVGFIAKSGKPDLWVHPLAAATRALEGRELAELALMQQAGARGLGFKLRLRRAERVARGSDVAVEALAQPLLKGLSHVEFAQRRRFQRAVAVVGAEGQAQADEQAALRGLGAARVILPQAQGQLGRVAA